MKDEKTKSSAIVKAAESAAIALTPETVLAYVNARATKQEIALFLNQCAMFGLNPFKREIYLIKYSDKDPATFVVGYEVYLKRAERSKNWAGLEMGTEGEGKNLKAWAKVYRKDWGERPLSHEVYWEEYAQFKDEWRFNKETGRSEKTGEKTLNKFWAEKPKTMLKKVAIEQALRMAFPDEFAGMPYAMEEMGIDQERLATATVVIDKYPGVQKAEVHAPAPVKDEFGGPAQPPPDDTEPEATEDQPAGGCSLADLEVFAKSIADLKALGFEEIQLYTAVFKKVGRQFAEPSELDAEEMKTAIAFLQNWKKTQEDRNKAAAKAVKK